MNTYLVKFCIGTRVRIESAQKVQIQALTLEEAYDIFSSLYNWTAIISIEQLSN